MPMNSVELMGEGLNPPAVLLAIFAGIADYLIRIEACALILPS
jgi:hypothetical protein